MTISGKQSKAARNLCDLSTTDEVAKYADVYPAVWRNWEAGRTTIGSDKLDKGQEYYENRGIVFIGKTGVDMPEELTRAYNGRDGFCLFMHDVYSVVRVTGGEICVWNVNEENWLKWLGEDYAKELRDKMEGLDNFTSKILADRNNTLLTATGYAEYKYFPLGEIPDKSIYVYGEKMALINFEDNDVNVVVLNEAGFADNFRVMFNSFWNNEAIDIGSES